MIYSFKSDKGKVREHNEDSYAFSDSKSDLFCAAIADGMGGHNCGEIASKIAVDETIAYLVGTEGIDESNIKSHMTIAIRNANKLIIEKSFESVSCSGMGTTIVLICVLNEKVYIEHVGDSRAYLIHDGILLQLTKDHSYIEELLKIGYLTKEEAKSHPRKNIITKALGAQEGSDPDFSSTPIKKDDIILLCTDGLTNMITNEELAEIASKIRTPEKLCGKLISSALKNGGRDNVTVAAIKL